MQATKQTVPATSAQPQQGAQGQVQPSVPAPLPLSLDDLQKVGGGLSPGGSW